MTTLNGFSKYGITTGGEVYNLVSGRLLRPQFSGQYQYLKVSLREAGKTYQRYVHRLVWETFIGPIPEGFQINHKDGNRRNNSLDNLECVTPGENSRHAWEHGLSTPEQKGKLKPQQVLAIRQLREEGRSLQYIAAMFNVSRATVSMIANRRTWSKL